MQTVRINRIVLTPTPAGATTCTLWYELASDPGTWILVSAAINVPSDGILVPPLDINYPDDDSVRLRSVANCGGTPYEEDVPPTTTTTTAGTTTTTTTVGTTTTTTEAPTTTTTTAAVTCKTYRINASEDVIGSADFDWIDCESAPQAAGLSPLGVAYICAQPGSITLEQPTEMTATELADGCNDLLFDPEEYAVGGSGPIPACHFDSTLASRSAGAAAQSAANGLTIELNVRFYSDGGGGAVSFKTYTFQPGNTTGDEAHAVDLDAGGACSNIFVEYLSVVLV